jgi:hypothetical protein
MEIYDGTWWAPPAQLETARGDPNDTHGHFDVIREALKFKASSILATDADRQRAKPTPEQFYPDVPPSDPNARQ